MRRILVLLAVVLSSLGLVGCAQPIGTVGYANGQRISEAEVDTAVAAFAQYGFDRSDVTLFVVEARAAKAIMAARQISPDAAIRDGAANDPQVSRYLNDADTREVALGVLDFAGLQEILEPHGLSVAVADTVELDPRYGRLALQPDPRSGSMRWVLTGLTNADTGALSVKAPK